MVSLEGVRKNSRRFSAGYMITWSVDCEDRGDTSVDCDRPWRHERRPCEAGCDTGKAACLSS